MILIKDENESYAHVAAKAVLTKWLRDAQAKVGNGRNAKVLGLEFRTNRDGPSWGIHMEYPITEKHGLEQVWDELGYALGGSPEYHTLVDAWSKRERAWDYSSEERFPENYPTPSERQLELTRRWTLTPPSVQELADLGLRVEAVADVAVLDRGQVAYLFEIRHKNPISQKKRRFYEKQAEKTATRVGVYELPAAWILGQTQPPSRIPDVFVIVPPG